MESFEAFISDMGPRPSKSHSIDRFPDKDGPYSKENCRWATKLEQSRNTRTCLIVRAFDKEMQVWEWSEVYGIPANIIRERIRLGWPPEYAVYRKVGAGKLWDHKKRGLLV
jgi:hypothetical protein